MNLPHSYFIELFANSGAYSRFELTSPRSIIGRHDSCTIQIGSEDPHVSNRHAEIILDNAGVSIEDLGSTNGIFVNGEKTVKTVLKHYDIIRFGTRGPRLRIVIEKKRIDAEFPLKPFLQRQFPEMIKEAETGFNPSESEERTTEGIDIFDVSPSPSEESLFDLSPCEEDVKHGMPLPGINTTVEIKKRIQKHLANTQDIEMLAKNHKMRDKILNDKNIGEPQKHLIATVTKAYRSMKHTHFIIFGAIIGILCACIIWFAYGYFNYKKEFSRAIDLKNQIASFDDIFEKARMQQGPGNGEMKRLYDKLQKVQSQFDSIKAKLEIKDRQKIFSDTVEVFLDEIMNEFNEKNYCIPQHMLERVNFYITLFTKEQRKQTDLLMQRRRVFFPEIETIFLRKNVPKILGYVAMQESLLDSNAHSQAGALGMWQFMENTGRRFNLTITESVDERLNWRQSTIAAAQYFRSLLSLFGDGRGILLAIAAYNAGEEKIKKALENVEDPIRDRDFWYLYRTSSILALETREYVPQVLARIIIDKHPDLYRFNHKSEL